MQRQQIWNYLQAKTLRALVSGSVGTSIKRTSVRNSAIGLVTTLAIVALTTISIAPLAQAQFASLQPGRTSISGSVLIEGDSLPASSIRVNVKSATGGEIATAYTDSSGRFQVSGPNSESLIVTVAEPGYEPVEQQVDRSSAIASIVLVLKKTRTFLPNHSGTVSVRELSIPGKARHEYEKGIERLAKKDPEGSIRYFKEATNAFPNYYEAFYQIGVANMELRRGPDAEQALQRAIDLTGGGYADPQVALGAILCEREAWGDAERVLRRAIDVDPNAWKAYLFLGQTLFAENRLEEAEKNAHEVILRKPEAASSYILLANIHIRRHEYVMALNQLDTFLKLQPTGPTADQARDVRAAAQRVVSRFQKVMTPPQFIY